MRKPLIVLTGMWLFWSLDLLAIEVGSIADSRFGQGWTLDGVNLQNTRAKLLATSNFGPSGTVPETVNITDVSGQVTHLALSTFDVFFIGYLRDGDADAFSPGELEAMQDWVEAGGTMVITCDDTGYDAVCNKFGPVPSASNAASPAVPTGASADHPVFDGPFGTVSELTMFGTRKYFADTAGFTVLAEDQNENPVMLEDQVGFGRIIVFTDVDIISDDSLSEGSGIDNDSDRFLGNLFAYLASEAGETFFINPGINGNWWNGPDRSGEGFQFEVVISNNQLVVVATFYTYDTEGNQIFMIAVGPAAGNEADVDVYITEGGLWGQAFDPDLVNETQWGTGTFTATSCNTMHMSLSPTAQYQAAGYTNLAYALKRLTVPAAPCPMPLPD